MPQNQDGKNFFKQLVHQHTAHLLEWAYFKTSDLSLAETLVEETFALLKRDWKRVQQNESHKRLLFGLLNSRILAFHRKNFIDYKDTFPLPPVKKKNRSDFFNSQGSWIEGNYPNVKRGFIHRSLKKTEDYLRWKNCMNKLPESSRSLLELRYFHNHYTPNLLKEITLSEKEFIESLVLAKLQLSELLLGK